MSAPSPLEKKPTSRSDAPKSPSPNPTGPTSVRDKLRAGCGFADQDPMLAVGGPLDPYGKVEQAPPSATPELLNARIAALNALVPVDAAISDATTSTRKWQQNNWNKYFSSTGGTPALHLAKGEYGALATQVSGMSKSATPEWDAFVDVSNKTGGAALGSVVGAGATKLAADASLRAALPALIGFIGSGTGAFIVGIVAGYVWDALVGLLSESSKEEVAADEAVQRAGAYAAQATAAIESQAAMTTADWRGDYQSLRDLIGDSTDVEVVRKLATWAEATATKIPRQSESDMALLRQLLERWALQHAGDEEDPGAAEGTNRASWRKVTKALDDQVTASGKTATGYARDRKGQITKRDLYVDQCRLEWSQYGLEPMPAIASLQKAVATTGHLHQVGGATVKCRELDVAAWKHEYSAAANPKLWEERVWRERTEPNRLGPGVDQRRLTVKVKLEEEDGVIYVVDYRYELEAMGRPWDAWSRSPE